MKKCYYIYESPWANDQVRDGVKKKISGQVLAFKDHFEVEEIGIKVRINNTVSKILKRIPFGPSSYQWKGAAQRIQDPNVLYIRKPLCDRGFDAFLKQVKHQYPDAKILMEIPTYPYDKELFSGIKNLPMYFGEVFYRNRLHKYVDRIVIFSEDTEIFGIPTIGIQNGIHIEDNPVRPAKTDTSEIHLIAVAAFQRAHGYERIIRGLDEYYKSGGTRNIILDFVGYGKESEQYIQLIQDLGLQEHIVFWGAHYGETLNQIYAQADIGMAPFGFYKHGIEISSALKVREYIARGLPVIAGSKQDIFTEETFPYYLEFPNDDSVVNMERIVDFYDRVYHSGETYSQVIHSIRDYAEGNISWRSTLSPVIEYLAEHI